MLVWWVTEAVGGGASLLPGFHCLAKARQESDLQNSQLIASYRHPALNAVLRFNSSLVEPDIIENLTNKLDAIMRFLLCFSFKYLFSIVLFMHMRGQKMILFESVSLSVYLCGFQEWTQSLCLCRHFTHQDGYVAAKCPHPQSKKGIKNFQIRLDGLDLVLICF